MNTMNTRRFSSSLRRSICLATCFCLSAHLQAQSVAGYVRDKSGQPISQAHVYLRGSSKVTVSNTEGYYYLRSPKGRSILRFSSIGYTTYTEEVMLTDKDTLWLNVELQTGIHDLSEAQVYADLRPMREDFVAGSAYYISPKELETFAHTDAVRLLRNVPGLRVREEDGYGLRPNIGMRGTKVTRSEKIVILEDGILMAPAPYAASAAYYFPSIGRMSGVEVIKGSSQIQYGPYTTGGAINLISSPIPDQLSAFMNVRGGSFSRLRGHAKAGNRWKHVGFLVETHQEGTEGFKELPSEDNTGFYKQDYLAKLRINTDPTADIYHYLQFKLGYMDERSNETYLGISSKDFEENPYRRYAASLEDVMKADQQQYSIQYGLESNRLNFKVIGYHNRFHRNWYKLHNLTYGGRSLSLRSILNDIEKNASPYQILKGDIDGDSLNIKANNRDYRTYGLQPVLGLQFGSTGLLRHQIELSLRYHYDEIDRFEKIDLYDMRNGTPILAAERAFGTNSNRIQSATTFSGYMRYQLQIGKQWLITPGLRYENILLKREDYGKNDRERSGKDLTEREVETRIWIPGVGVNCFISSVVSTFFGVHKGFSPPTDDPRSRPEESINYELGTRITPSGGRYDISSVIFFNDYKNMQGSLLNAAAENLDLINEGAVQATGLELGGSAELIKKKRHQLSLQANYTFTRVVFQSDFLRDDEIEEYVKKGDEMPYVSPHTGSLTLNYTFNKKLSLSLQNSYTSSMKTTVKPAAIETDPLLNIDLNAEYSLGSQLSFYGQILNVTGTEVLVSVLPHGHRPNLRRSFLIGARYSL